LDYTREQIETLSKILDKKTKKKRINAEEKRMEALSKAYQIADLLKIEFGVGKVYLFGSLAWRDKFSIHSDIDLYLADLPAEYSYWDVLVTAERVAQPYLLNLVLAENACESLRNKVEKKGIIL